MWFYQGQRINGDLRGATPFLNHTFATSTTPYPWSLNPLPQISLKLPPSMPYLPHPAPSQTSISILKLLQPLQSLSTNTQMLFPINSSLYPTQPTCSQSSEPQPHPEPLNYHSPLQVASSPAPVITTRERSPTKANRQTPTPSAWGLPVSTCSSSNMELLRICSYSLVENLLVVSLGWVGQVLCYNHISVNITLCWWCIVFEL